MKRPDSSPLTARCGAHASSLWGSVNKRRILVRLDQLLAQIVNGDSCGALYVHRSEDTTRHRQEMWGEGEIDRLAVIGFDEPLLNLWHVAVAANTVCEEAAARFREEQVLLALAGHAPRPARTGLWRQSRCARPSRPRSR